VRREEKKDMESSGRRRKVRDAVALSTKETHEKDIQLPKKPATTARKKCNYYFLSS
jgi:hypothetical protein